MNRLIFLLLLIPGVLQAQIYRCEDKGDAYFSQIPCAENSESVIIEDRMMNSDSAQGNVAVQKEQMLSSKPGTASKPRKSQLDKLTEFVATLERQRDQQMEILNRDMATLQTRIDQEGEELPHSKEYEAMSAELSDLRVSSQSVDTQYDSMIQEAQRRVADLSAQASTAN